MKLTVLGVKNISGNAKETGNPFTISRLIAITPIEMVNQKNVQISGHGFEVAELELDPDSLNKFAGLKFPISLDLETDSKAIRGKFETVVTGFVQPAKVANG